MSDLLEMTDKFMTIRADTKDITVLGATWYNKPVVKLGVAIKRDTGTITREVILVNREKITQLLEMLEIPISPFYVAFRDTPGALQIELQKAIDAADTEVFLKASSFVNEERADENWYVFAVTSERHVIVPHQLLENKIKTRFKGHDVGVVREQMHKTPVWTVRLRDWSQKNKEGKIIERFEAFIIVSGGRNVKKGRIHVIPMVKMGSCDNSIRAIEHIEINHTEGWERKFDKSLDEAHLLVTRMREVIRLSMSHYMDGEAIQKMLKEILSDLLISDDRIQMIFLTVMERIANTHGEGRATVWDVVQAVTYVGSHPDEAGIGDVVTDHAQEQLQAMGYRFAERAVVESMKVKPVGVV